MDTTQLSKTEYKAMQSAHFPHLHDVLFKVNDTLYNGVFNQHEIVEDGYIDGYDVMGGSHVVYVFNFGGNYSYGDDYGYVSQEVDGKFYMDIEDCGYIKNTLRECYEILCNYFEANSQ